VTRDLLAGLCDRGLEVTRPILVGSTAPRPLRRTVLEVFDHPVIHRLKLHLSAMSPTGSPMLWPRRWPCGCGPPPATLDPLTAQAHLEALARELDRSYPGAAGLLRGWPRS
jgi:putative transposase